MEIIIAVTAFLASFLTFFSGFGLSTVLTPVFIIFFPIDLAITFTAIVHFLNNLFKSALIGKFVNWKIVALFGLPAMLSAVLGSSLLMTFSEQQPLYTYEFLSKEKFIEPVNLTMGILIILFALLEIIPFFNRINAGKKYLVLGGLLSGFFGGLSGHQGALRSVFLLRFGLSKEAFIASGVMIAFLIDISRMTVYFTSIPELKIQSHFDLIAIATGAAFAGAAIGRFSLKKISLTSVRWTVTVVLIVFGVGLATGLL